MFDRRLIECFDWFLLFLILALSAVGVFTIYSAVNAGGSTAQSNFYIKQMIWFGVGGGLMVVCFLFNYRLLERYSYLVYGACIILLLSVLIVGKQAGGSQRWLAFGPFTLQPSELAKLGVIIVLAGFYSKRATIHGLSLIDLLLPAAMVGIPFLLVAKQPDLGTAGLIALIATSMTLFVKIERRSLLFLFVSGLVAAPSVWFLLKSYQKNRIMTFIDPTLDPLGAGYHIIQSKIAIGSGMLAGKGYLQGTQNALAFLPEQHTDFIFSVLAEEWGFGGAAILLLLFLALIFRGLTIAYQSRDPFGAILAAGVVAFIFWEALINIGMVMGLMPVVGAPLPFISYGGSSTITVMISMGLLLNISMRRFMAD
jgi:rod shape determining protein RodA